MSTQPRLLEVRRTVSSRMISSPVSCAGAFSMQECLWRVWFRAQAPARPHFLRRP
jgi:hypothetical protein